ncbi:MAG: nucleotidyltransferase family protein [Candidatus Eremiobacteraeota bacterium]|nr:nucleotidyltransferase family protein [Candidatus Eremiobacteraeota bacterium]MCW5870152.1 nucleotidyltransferase family protein [Candidatus Eremiobacteraeota bacterium]
MKAVLLAGGPVGKLTLESGDTAGSKGLVRVGGQPLAWRTLQGLRAAQGLTRIVLVGGDRHWEGVDAWVPGQETLMGSFEAGVNACQESHEPVLVCCGDLPFLPGEALDDFLQRCRLRPEASLWYCYLRQENSLRKYPRLAHTWARLQDGTYCGSGVMMLRPEVMQRMRAAMERLTQARKNMFKLAGCLGWGNLLNYGLGRLTVARAEKAGQGIFGVRCAGIETPYAELGFNVDDADSLREARRILQEVGDPYASSRSHG